MQNYLVSNTELGEQVIRAKADEGAFAELMRSYSRHIKYVAYKTVGRFVSENDDEWAVALEAFYEAVRKYDPQKGSFTGFSDVVISRRLLDQIRKSKRNVEEVPLEEVHNDIAEKENSSVTEEISILSGQLESYGITFDELAEASPKAEKTRKACARVICFLTEDPALMERLRCTHALPAKEIMKNCGVPQKLLERHRKYIIAAAEIICSDMPHLQQFMKTIRKDGQS